LEIQGILLSWGWFCIGFLTVSEIILTAAATHSAYTGVSGQFSVEDLENFNVFILNLRLYENRDVPVIYSNIPL
jgi:hypothetical protein